MRFSYSKIACYERCPAQFKFKYVEKLPEDSGPHANRGTRIHSLFEQVIKTKEPIEVTVEEPCDEEIVVPYNEYLIHLSNQGVVPEAKLAITEDWQKPTTPAEVWATGILDAKLVQDNLAHVWDWKTGKHYESHEDQGEFYAGLVFANFPEVEVVKATFVYVDERRNWPLPELTRGEDFPRIQENYRQRSYLITIDDLYAPNPGWYCNYCSFAKKKGGPCQFGS